MADVAHGMMKVIVCGGRNYTDRYKVFRVLDDIMNFNEDHIFIFHGDCSGADELAHEWAVTRGFPVAAIPAHWDFYSKSAGPRRNGWMLELKPDFVVAFPGKDGTKNMIAQAEKAGVPVKVVTDG